MNTIANKQAICNVLLEASRRDRDIVVLCSDSRGSASMGGFARERPDQFVEVGIAEQNLVGISAGLARCGKKAFAVSPACFLSSRSMEQAKVDAAYSGTNVTLVGVSGGVSYGALGMTHHSTNDIAVMASIPGMRVYLPSDRFQTAALIRALLEDEKPAYVRVGRNPVPDVYDGEDLPFAMDRAARLREGGDLAIIACGELVKAAVEAADELETRGIHARVLDMYCVKPIDRPAVEQAARETGGILTIEEHTKYGGLGSMTAQIVSETCPRPVRCLTLPDAPAVTGNSREVFDHYGLNAQGLIEAAAEMMKHG
ncbi:MAG: transketolase family protein [Clostridiales bacterium]|nr:transketolase family protein [Clostridiales bacterium]